MPELSKIEIPVQEATAAALSDAVAAARRSAGWLIGWFGPELMIH
jgi:hypothetical protein